MESFEPLVARQEQEVNQEWDPSSFQKRSFWTLWPAIVVIPLWMCFGKSYLGGPGGWNTILLLSIASPVVILYHTAVAVTALIRNRQRDGLDREDYFLSKRTSYTFVAYYACHLMLQVFMDDGGDQGNMGSVAERYFRTSKTVAEAMTAVFFFAIILLMITTLVLVCLEDH